MRYYVEIKLLGSCMQESIFYLQNEFGSLGSTKIIFENTENNNHLVSEGIKELNRDKGFKKMGIKAHYSKIYLKEERG